MGGTWEVCLFTFLFSILLSWLELEEKIDTTHVFVH